MWACISVQGFWEAGTSETNVSQALKDYIACPTPSMLNKYLCDEPVLQTPSTAVQLSPGLVVHSTPGLSRYGCLPMPGHLSDQVMSCHVMSCHVMSCHVMSCHVMSCHVMSCHVMSCHVICFLMAAILRTTSTHRFPAARPCNNVTTRLQHLIKRM